MRCCVEDVDWSARALAQENASTSQSAGGIGPSARRTPAAASVQAGTAAATTEQRVLSVAASRAPLRQLRSLPTVLRAGPQVAKFHGQPSGRRCATPPGTQWTLFTVLTSAAQQREAIAAKRMRLEEEIPGQREEIARQDRVVRCYLQTCDFGGHEQHFVSDWPVLSILPLCCG